MSDKLAKWAEAGKVARKSDRSQSDSLSPGERKALWKMRDEAKAAGSQLTSGGKGGLPPSLVLGVMRKAHYRCKACGEVGDMQKNGGLGVHHKSEHMEDPKAQARSKLLGKLGRIDAPSNVVAMCGRCHDHIHQEDRQENPQEGDKEWRP